MSGQSLSTDRKTLFREDTVDEWCWSWRFLVFNGPRMGNVLCRVGLCTWKKSAILIRSCRLLKFVFAVCFDAFQKLYITYGEHQYHCSIRAICSTVVTHEHPQLTTGAKWQITLNIFRTPKCWSGAKKSIDRTRTFQFQYLTTPTHTADLHRNSLELAISPAISLALLAMPEKYTTDHKMSTILMHTCYPCEHQE